MPRGGHSARSQPAGDASHGRGGQAAHRDRVYIDDCVKDKRRDGARSGWVLKTHEQAAAADHEDDLMTGDSEADADALSQLMNDPLRAPVDAGFARVQWIGMSEPEVVPTGTLEVIDRPHLLGDTVARADDPGGESGMICEVRSAANLRFVLSGRELLRHRSVELQAKVCDGDVAVHTELNWAGFVRGAVFSVVIATEGDEAIFVFPSLSSQEDPKFHAVNDDEDPGLCPHFSGQQVDVDRETLVTAECVAAPESWGGDIPHRDGPFRFTVKSVQLEEVVMDWACQGPKGGPHPPAMIMPAAQLEWLRLSDKGYRVGDYVRVSDVDGLGPASDEAERTARITSTVTECRVLWATSGVVEDRWIPSTELVPRPPTLSKDFGPMSFVMPTEDFVADVVDQARRRAGGPRSAADLDALRNDWLNKVGIVHVIDVDAQQCTVHWVKEESFHDRVDDPGQEGLYPRPGVRDGLATQTLDTYDVEACEFVYLPGDIVRRFDPDQHVDCGCRRHAHASGTGGGGGGGGGKHNGAHGGSTKGGDGGAAAAADAAADPVAMDVEGKGDEGDGPAGAQASRDWVGQVLGISRTGFIRVRWHSGAVAMESPFDLELVGDTPEDLGDDESEEPEKWEDEEGHEVDLDDDEWEDVDDDDDDDGDSDGDDEDGDQEDATARRTDPDEASAMETEPGVPAAAAAEAAAAAADDGDTPSEYAAFEVLSSAPPDHAFFREASTSVSPRAVAKEARTLMKGLPQDGSIAIRGYEDRSDLFRAVVFGPPDTPYAGVPFFFDIFLPADYPKSPPKMLYWAGATRERLNPNLYENGKVCLSLLGTWNGPGWDPKKSSILQLLLSVQGLVLVDEPYFNEPGFEKLKGTAEGTRNSKLYSENAMVLSLQSLNSLWGHPPSGFRPILRARYLGQGEGAGLLERCRKLVQGTEEERSAGFARLLEKRVIPKLEKFFQPTDLHGID